jgi:hypothetical protein
MFLKRLPKRLPEHLPKRTLTISHVRSGKKIPMTAERKNYEKQRREIEAIQEVNRSEIKKLRKESDALFEFADRADSVDTRHREGTMHMMRDFKIPSTTLPYIGETPKYMPLPNPVGIFARVVHGIIPFDQTLNPAMLPYDARYTNLKYYAIMLTNLIDSSYNSFMQLPPEVKLEISDNFVSMVKFSMIGKYLLTRNFIVATQELESPVQHRCTPEVEEVLNQNVAQRELMDDKYWVSRTIGAKSQDRKHFVMQFNIQRKDVFIFKAEKMGDAARGRSDQYGRIGLENEFQLYEQEFTVLRTQLDLAVQMNDYELATVLLSHFPDQNLSLETVEFLVKFYHVNAMYLNLFTPLELLAVSQNFRFIMPAKGVDITLKDLMTEKVLLLSPIRDVLKVYRKQTQEENTLKDAVRLLGFGGKMDKQTDKNKEKKRLEAGK